MAPRSAVGKLEIRRRQRRLRLSVGSQLIGLRVEAGATQTALAAAAGIDQGHISRVERGEATPGFDALVALAGELGADVSVRLFPTATVGIRDRLQAPMVEALLRRAAEPWRATVEVPVAEARGVIDVVLRNRAAGLAIACEVHSQLRSVDLVLRRLHEKTLAFRRLEPATTVSSALVIRSTEATRRMVRLLSVTFAATLPGDHGQALDALAARADWPGTTLLWVTLENGRAELLERPPRGVSVGR
jgi:transcriptional regulator with XRE-family HTH domain